jgi:hypothetical protein
MKILFLDIDGVLTTPAEFQQGYVSEKYNNHLMYPFNKKCVDNLKRIISETGANIVLSTSWKRQHPLDEMNEIFKDNNVNLPILDSTPNDVGDFRGHEINLWIEQNKDNIDSFCVVDDLDLSACFVNFVKTEPRVGLTDGDADEIIAILNNKISHWL